MKSLFIASTHQHIGKTTLSLGLFAGIKKHIAEVAYMKPVGQQQVSISSGLFVDKDAIIFKKHFQLPSTYEQMSPVLVPPGFTRDFLDGKKTLNELVEKLQTAHTALKKSSDFLVIEGTGHCGVGSILGLNNAQVAKMLGAPILLVVSGGLGASFDELMLNKTLCDHYNVPIVGVILNKVRKDKLEMVRHYMTKALKRWDIPLLGCIPEDPLLSRPSCQDFETLFHTPLLSGKEHHVRHFTSVRLISTPQEAKEPLKKEELLIIPASREEMIRSILSEYWKEKTLHPNAPYRIGLILTEGLAPSHSLIEALIEADVPMLYTPLHSQHVMEKIHDAKVKIQVEDTEKVEEAIALVQEHVDFQTTLKMLEIKRL